MVTCSKGTLLANSLIRSRALMMAYGSNVFLLVHTEMLPSIRSREALMCWQGEGWGGWGNRSHKKKNKSAQKCCTLQNKFRQTYCFSQGFLHQWPALLQVGFSVLGEEGGEAAFLQQTTGIVLSSELGLLPAIRDSQEVGVVRCGCKPRYGSITPTTRPSRCRGQ